MASEGRGILSPVRLPVPPLQQVYGTFEFSSFRARRTVVVFVVVLPGPQRSPVGEDLSRNPAKLRHRDLNGINLQEGRIQPAPAANPPIFGSALLDPSLGGSRHRPGHETPAPVAPVPCSSRPRRRLLRPGRKVNGQEA